MQSVHFRTVGEPIRVMTYNVLLSGIAPRALSGRADVTWTQSVEEVANSLIDARTNLPVADIVLMQEIGHIESWKMLMRRIQSHYPYQTRQSETLAIVSARTAPMTAHEDTKLFATNQLYKFGTRAAHFDGMRLSVLDIHLNAWPQDAATRMLDAQEARRRLDALRRDKPRNAFVVAGDFNTAMSDDIAFSTIVTTLGVPGLHNPSVNRPKWANSFFEWALDTWYCCVPTPTPHSGGSMFSSRLDYVFLYPSLDRNLMLTKLDERILLEAKASDHKPVVVTFQRIQSIG